MSVIDPVEDSGRRVNVAATVPPVLYIYSHTFLSTITLQRDAIIIVMNTDLVDLNTIRNVIIILNIVLGRCVDNVAKIYTSNYNGSSKHAITT